VTVAVAAAMLTATPPWSAAGVRREEVTEHVVELRDAFGRDLHRDSLQPNAL
jgi:hypothetical protein